MQQTVLRTIVYRCKPVSTKSITIFIVVRSGKNLFLIIQHKYHITILVKSPFCRLQEIGNMRADECLHNIITITVSYTFKNRIFLILQKTIDRSPNRIYSRSIKQRIGNTDYLVRIFGRGNVTSIQNLDKISQILILHNYLIQCFIGIRCFGCYLNTETVFTRRNCKKHCKKRGNCKKTFFRYCIHINIFYSF